MFETGQDSTRTRLSFSLLTKIVSYNKIAIVMRIFRAGVCVLTKQIAMVDGKHAVYVFCKCREDLERRGFAPFAGVDLGDAIAQKRLMAAR